MFRNSILIQHILGRMRTSYETTGMGTRPGSEYLTDIFVKAHQMDALWRWDGCMASQTFQKSKGSQADLRYSQVAGTPLSSQLESFKFAWEFEVSSVSQTGSRDAANLGGVSPSWIWNWKIIQHTPIPMPACNTWNVGLSPLFQTVGVNASTSWGSYDLITPRHRVTDIVR